MLDPLLTPYLIVYISCKIVNTRNKILVSLAIIHYIIFRVHKKDCEIVRGSDMDHNKQIMLKAAILERERERKIYLSLR